MMKKLIIGVVVTCVLLVVPVTAAVRILRDKVSSAESQ